MILGHSPFQIVDPLEQVDIGDQMLGEEKGDGVRRRKLIRYVAWALVAVNLVLGAALLWPRLPDLEDRIECRQAQFVLTILNTATAMSEQDCLARRARERASPAIRL